MNFDRTEPSASNLFQADHARLITGSHIQLTQIALLPEHQDPVEFSRNLYHAPFVVLAHDTAPDPIFFYANRTAQQLFEMTWREMVHLPSRHSAEPLAREARQRLLNQVSCHGYIDDYSGVRVSSTGKRFLIERATVWNLINAEERVVGQAASFSAWIPLT